MPELAYAKVTDYANSDDFTKKHTPLISAERNGEAVSITIEVGKEVPHPNQLDHYITFIELYHGMTPIARFDLSPLVTSPKVTITCNLPENATVTALEHCNLHGVWTCEAVV